jgi:tetratricopeptide (TPR) repeat protein
MAYERAGRSEEGRALIAALGDLPEESRRDLSVVLYFAQLDVEAGRYDEAVHKLRPVAEQDTALSPSAWSWIGAAYQGKGEIGEARAAYEKALDSYHRSGRPGTRAMLGLGMIEMEARRLEEAALWFRRACEEAIPNDPRPVFNLGLTLEKMGHLEEAHRLCGESLALEGRVPPTIRLDFTIFTDMYLEMGIIAEKLGRTEEAVRHFEEALRRSPDHPQREGIVSKIRDLRGRPAAP